MITAHVSPRIAATVAAAALATLVIACGAAPEPPPPPGPALTSAEMGLALASVPQPFVADAATDAGRWELRPDGKEGALTVELGAPGEVNLVASVQQHQAAAEARESAEYLGAGELAGPLGAVFWSRARQPGEAGGSVEETKLFALHPAGDRQVVITYVYPAAEDSSERVQEAIAVLAELEGWSGPTS